MAAISASFNAVDVKDVWTITVANTWAAAGTATVTIGVVDLVVTIGSLVTTAQVATSIKEAWESASFTDTTASKIPQGGGTVIGPMSLYTATVSGSTVILTADTAGMPQTISVSEVTAGTGTLSIAHTTTGTGKTDWSNVDNWVGGVVPVTADDVTINLPGSFTTGLAQSAVTLASLTLGPRFNGWIGLKVQNVDNSSYPWYENRATELAIGATVVTNNSACTLVRINQAAVVFTATSNSTGTSAETGRKAFEIRGTNASNVLNVFGGDNGVAVIGETATVLTINQDGGTLTVGTVVTLTTLAKLAGTATINCAATTISSSSGTVTQTAGALTTLNLNGGTGVMSGAGGLTTVNMLAGTLTVDGTRGTITTLTKTAGTAYVYTTVTTATNTAGALTLTTGGMTLLTNSGEFTHSGSVTLAAIVQLGGTVTLTHASSVVTLLTKAAGNAYLAGSCVTSTNTSGTLAIGSGNVTALTSYSGAVTYGGVGTFTAATIYGGLFTSSSGAFTFLYVVNGTASIRGAGTMTLLRQVGGKVTVYGDVTAVTSLDKANGECDIYCATATAVNEGGALSIHAGAMTTLSVVNGTCNYNGGNVTLTTVNVSNQSVFSVDGNTLPLTITTLSITDSATFRNATGRVTFTNPITFQGVLSLKPN